MPNNSRGFASSSVVLLCLILLSISSIGRTNGFHPRSSVVPLKKAQLGGMNKGNLGSSLFASSATSPSSPNPGNRRSSRKLSPDDKRRAFLAKIGATAVTSTAALYYRGSMQQPKAAPVVSDEGTKNALKSVDQAVKVLEAECDRRFLHAVVATDYKLLYRGIPCDLKLPTIVEKEPSDLLLPSTYGSTEAAAYFQNLENGVMKGKAIQPSNGHLATTSINDARQWGGQAASVWPLAGNVHFAWLEQGGDFWTPSTTNQKPAIIIDGVDCGKDSLDYALEREDSEIMFRADRYLLVPVELEPQLLSKLKNAYLI